MRHAWRVVMGVAVAALSGGLALLGASSVHAFLGSSSTAQAVEDPGATPPPHLGITYVDQPPPNEVFTTGLIAQVAARAEPAVVSITAQMPGESESFGFFTFQSPPQTGVGSGFLISPNGYILTNDHVIQGAQSIQVTVPGYPHPFPARVVGASFPLDLAVLKIQAPRPLPSLPLGNSASIRVGEWDIAIGNPYGLSNTLTVGVISAEGRPLTIGNRNYQSLLQTDAPINPGNSGGPLLNLAGQVIGINTAVNAAGQGLGFAIPIDTVRRVLTQLITKGYVPHPWLGVDVTSSPNGQGGAMVVDVLPGSPAQQVGLQSGDLIVALNGKPVRSPQDLVNLVASASVGQVVSLTVVRAGQTLHLRVRLAQEPNSLPQGQP